MPGPRSLYDVLNVSPEAEPVVVEAAYRALMKRYHPDQADGTSPSRDAAAINEAFAILKDPARRSEYDRRLWKKRQAARLAELQVLEPKRGSRLFGWGGWAVAVALGAAFASLAAERSAPRNVPPGVRAAVDKGRLGPETAATIRKAADADLDILNLPPSAAAVLASRRAGDAGPAPALNLRLREVAPSVREMPRRQRPAARPVRSAPSAKARAEEDFVARQGGIY